MKILHIVFLSMFVLALPLFHASAQSPADWSVWLANFQDGALVRLEPATGNVELFVINAPEFPVGIYTSMTVSPDRSLLAYCSGGTTDYYTPADQTLVIYSLTQNAVLQTQALGVSETCGLTGAGWSSDGAQLAFSVLNYFAQAPDPALPSWEIHVLDIANNSYVATLSAITAGSEYEQMLPNIRFFFPESTVTAIMEPFGVGGPIYTLPAFDWSISANSVQANALYGNIGLSIFGGEVVWSEYDPALPAITLQGPGNPVNVILTSDKSGQHRAIFQNPTAVLGDPIYINDGNQIAFTSYDNNYNFVGWTTLDRTGAIGTLPIATPYYNNTFDMNILGTPQGVAFVDHLADDTTVSLFNVADGSTSVIWQDASFAWGLIQADPMLPSSTFQTFPTAAP